MGVAELKKVELYYHKSVQDDVAEALQYSGACQVIDGPETEPRSGARLGRENTGARLAVCEEQQTHLRYLFRALGPYFTDPVSSIDRMLGEKPVLSMTELERTANGTDLGKLALSVKDMETTLNDLRVEASQHETDDQILFKIADFPYSLDILSDGTRTLKGILGSLAEGQLEALTEALKPFSRETELFAASRTSAKEREVWCVLMYARAHEHQILDAAVESGMVFSELPPHITGTVAEERAKLEARKAECERKEAEILEELKRTASEWMPVAQRLSDYWNVMAERYQAMEASDDTESTFRTRLWVPADALPNLVKRVGAASSDTAFVASDPEEGDNPPTLLKNNAFNKPAEVLTNLYSPPVYGQRDPTSPMAPFFFLFFGMCLGDAGYAIVMASVLWMLFKKYRKIPAGTRNFMNLFCAGAAATFLYGLITGSFFGDFIDSFFFMSFLRPVKDALLVVDPMKNPMAILVVSLLLGVVHLMFGLGVAAYDEFRKGNYADAVGGKISWILFVVGLLLIGMGSAGILPPPLHSAGIVMAIVGTCLIFWYAGREEKNIFLKVGLGLYALYGSTSYLGDILSYSRLLALGLGSAVIGTVINLLGKMISGVPVIGWTLAILVVVGGHVFSIAINLLGAFVHAMRLQYVEFFSKFYSGDGVNFNPLGFHTQYVDIADEAKI